MGQQGWLWLFTISLALLIIVLIRAKPKLRWFGYALTQVVLCAVILFIINGTGLFGDFFIPINLVTIMTMVVLGIPGVVLLALIKITLI